VSLDVYLELDAPPTAPNGGSGIYVRRNGQTVEISREEWDRAFPGQEPVVLSAECDVDCTVYHDNITHNLGGMAMAAGIYKHLWRPDEIEVTKARELIEPLARGLDALRIDPGHFKALNPPNGWGNYDGLVRFVSAYLDACKRYPEATVSVSR
jgi:hypothetical protein